MSQHWQKSMVAHINEWGRPDKSPRQKNFTECMLDTLPLRRWSWTPHSLSVGCEYWVTSFLKIQYKSRGVGESDSTVEKTHNHHLSHPIKINISSEQSCWRYVPLLWCDRNHIHQCGFLLPQTHNPGLCTIKKTSKRSQLRDSKLSKSSKTREVWDTVTTPGHQGN